MLAAGKLESRRRRKSRLSFPVPEACREHAAFDRPQGRLVNLNGERSWHWKRRNLH